MGRPQDTGISERILQAAAMEVAEKGLFGTTVEAIVRRAGTGKGNFYRRWTSLEPLLADVLAGVAPPLLRVGDDPLDDLVIALMAWAGGPRRSRKAVPVMRLLEARAAGSGLDDDLDAVLERLSVSLDQALDRVLETYPPRRTVEVEAVRDMLIGPVLARLVAGGPRVGRDFVELVVEVVLRGLGCRLPRTR